MDESLNRVVKALDAMVDTSFVWPNGLLHPGGPHRRLRGHRFPISIGEDECLAFGKLIAALRPEHCFIIGNAFGFSSVYIADAMKAHGGKSVITLDNQSEGAGAGAAKIAQGLSEAVGTQDILHNKKGSSPADIPTAVEQAAYQLVFIDGLHSHPQVTLDFEGVLPYCAQRGVVVFHDSWIVGVPEAVERAKRAGFRCLWAPTSCEMIFATRDPELFAQLQQIFPEAVEDQEPRSYLYGVTVYARDSISYHVNRMLGRA